MAEYLIQGSTLTALADAIRAMTGSTGPLSLDQIVSDVVAMEPSVSENNRLTNVNISEDTNTYTLTFANGSTITGTIEFDENGLPVSVADDAGNSVEFLDGQPSSATDSDGHTVSIQWG